MQLKLYSNRNVFMQGYSFQIIPALIDDDSSLNEIDYSDISYTILNGNTLISVLDETKLIFNLQGAGSIAILITYDNGLDILQQIFYAEIVESKIILDKEKIYSILMQELPENVYCLDRYDNQGNQLPMYTDNISSAQIVEELYNKIYQVFQQIYPENQYTPYWEFALNGTTNLFSNLQYATDLLRLLNNINTEVAMTVWDLEYFLTRYIFYRTGVSTLVYINDYSVELSDYWILGISKLGVNTKLAPANLENSDIQIVIFNSLTAQVQYEVNLLIQRLLRPDISYSIIFTNDNPTTYDLVTVNYTYKFDPRLIYNKALKFLDNNYPFNLIGYTRNT